MTLRIALLMMQKNENLLLEPWITYHRNLVDPGSIFLFDNGSSDPHTLSILRAAENSGIPVNRSFSELKHYHERGIIFANLIKELDANNPHDFYFPMDCDEFMGCELNNRLSCQPKDIEASLENHLRSDKVLTVPHKYANNPYIPNHYAKMSHVKKCFFARDACDSLTDGFHYAQSRAGLEEEKTNITYFEFHFKPYTDHQRMSRQKIAYLVPNQRRRTLTAYLKSQRSNFHAAKALLESEYTYIRSFDTQTQPIYKDSTLLARFAELGIKSSQLFDQKGRPNLLRWAKLRGKHELLRARDKIDVLYTKFRSPGV